MGSDTGVGENAMMTFDEWHSAQMHGEDKPCPYEENERFAWYACMLELHKVIAWDRQSWDDDPVFGPLIKQAYSHDENEQKERQEP